MRKLTLCATPLLVGLLIIACGGTDAAAPVDGGGTSTSTSGDGGGSSTSTSSSSGDGGGSSTSSSSGDGGGSTTSSSSGDAGIPTYSVSGQVTGLAGKGLVLQNNGGDDLAVNAAGGFTFAKKLGMGAAYAVTVKTQPTDPTQTCAVTAGGNGSIAGADVKTVAVTCTTKTFKISGTVSKLLGTVVLQNNGGDDVTVNADGAFSFATPVASGQNYNVTIKTQPKAVNCTVQNGGPSKVAGVDIGDVAVTCAPTGPAGLVYYFPFEGNGKDYSGNGHDLTNVGATLTTDRFGNADSAYAFDGSQHMTADGASLPIGLAARTLTMWMKMADQHGQWGIVHWGDGDCNSLMFGLGYQGATTFWGGCNDLGSNSQIALDTWTFVAVVFEPNNTIKLWTDGVVLSQTAAELATTASKLWIGAETTNDQVTGIRNHFVGSLDAIRIYNRALSDQEIADVAQLK